MYGRPLLCLYIAILSAAGIGRLHTDELW